MSPCLARSLRRRDDGYHDNKVTPSVTRILRINGYAISRITFMRERKLKGIGLNPTRCRNNTTKQPPLLLFEDKVWLLLSRTGRKIHDSGQTGTLETLCLENRSKDILRRVSLERAVNRYRDFAIMCLLHLRVITSSRASSYES